MTAVNCVVLYVAYTETLECVECVCPDNSVEIVNQMIPLQICHGGHTLPHIEKEVYIRIVLDTYGCNQCS